jgi:pyrroline-5-carboxylate reductase
MGTALLGGWVAKHFTPVIVVEPNPSTALKHLAARSRVSILSDIAKLPKGKLSACVVAIKPQVLRGEAGRLADIAKSGVPMLSIAAGTDIASLRAAWGQKARIIRAMPNTPGSIGKGITGIFAASGVGARDKALAVSLLSALGEVFWVKEEGLIDSVTAVSGSGPAYVFLFVEALADAAEAEGFPRAIAEKLARATVTGSGALLDADKTDPAELRAAVTSKGGTTQAALDVLMASDGLAQLIRRAVEAARKRAKELARQ